VWSWRIYIAPLNVKNMPMKQTLYLYLESANLFAGIVLAAQSVFTTLGYESHFAYTIGGKVAHSLLEVETNEGTALLDIYNGVAFLNKDTDAPLDLNAVIKAAQTNDNICLYAKIDCHKFYDLNHSDIFIDKDDHNRDTFIWPDNFLNLDGYGLSGSGHVDFNIIHLKPTQILGNEHWQTGLVDEPTPYTKLAYLRKPDGSALSWAYMMGQTGLGYHLQHSYLCSDLVPGVRYSLKIGLINAFGFKDFTVRWTMRALHSDTHIKKMKITPIEQDYLSDYKPHYVQFDFVAIQSTEVILSHLEGELLLASIGLYKQIDTEN